MCMAFRVHFFGPPCIYSSAVSGIDVDVKIIPCPVQRPLLSVRVRQWYLPKSVFSCLRTAALSVPTHHYRPLVTARAAYTAKRGGVVFGVTGHFGQKTLRHQPPRHFRPA